MFFIFFFFKQKTAYEMRISDWSSDVCSSDLLNLYQYLIDETDQDEICAPPLDITSSVKAKLCTRVESISSDKTKITLKSRAQFKYKGEWHGVSLGSRTIYAPFGYLADLSDRKEKKMDELQSKVAKRLASRSAENK